MSKFRKISFKNQHTGEVISRISVPFHFEPYETQQFIQDERQRINTLTGIPMGAIVYSPIGIQT